MVIEISNTRVDEQGSRVIDNMDEEGFILASEDMAVIEAILETDIGANFQFSTTYCGDHHWWLKSYETNYTVYRFNRMEDVQKRAPFVHELIIEEYLVWICNMARLLYRDRSVKFDYHIPHNNVIRKLLKWYDRQELCEALNSRGDEVPGVLMLCENADRDKYKKLYSICNSSDLPSFSRKRIQASASIMGEFCMNDFALINLAYFKELSLYLGDVYRYRVGISPKINEVIDKQGLNDAEERVARRLIAYIRRII